MFECDRYFFGCYIFFIHLLSPTPPPYRRISYHPQPPLLKSTKCFLFNETGLELRWVRTYVVLLIKCEILLIMCILCNGHQKIKPVHIVMNEGSKYYNPLWKFLVLYFLKHGTWYTVMFIWSWLLIIHFITDLWRWGVLVLSLGTFCLF